MSAFPACAYHAGSRSHAECMRALLVSCSRLSSVLCAFTRVRTAGRPQPRRPELDGHDGGQPGDEAKQSHACCPSTVMDCLTVRLSRRTMLTVFNPMPLHIPFFPPPFLHGCVIPYRIGCHSRSSRGVMEQMRWEPFQGFRGVSRARPVTVIATPPSTSTRPPTNPRVCY